MIGTLGNVGTFSFDHGKFEQKAVTAVITGNRDPATMAAQTARYAGLDGRLSDLTSEVPAHEMPWISDRWTAHFRWQGEGPMPAAERTKLQGLVQEAHRHGRLVRFWATPELPVFWRELRSAGVDLINTDDLAGLQQAQRCRHGPADPAGHHRCQGVGGVNLEPA